MNDCITAREYAGGITAIDSGMVRPQMAACYLLETDSAIAVIETGNAASPERILKVVERRGRRPEIPLDAVAAGGRARAFSTIVEALARAGTCGRWHASSTARARKSALPIRPSRRSTPCRWTPS